jgi:hypothetical protein
VLLSTEIRPDLGQPQRNAPNVERVRVRCARRTRVWFTGRDGERSKS